MIITILFHCIFFNIMNIFADGKSGMWELNIAKTPVRYRDAVRAAIHELVKTKEKPEDFYAQFPEKPNNEPVIILNLWHKSAFNKTNFGKAGNPGGKCRNIHFDKQQHKVIKVLFWQ